MKNTSNRTRKTRACIPTLLTIALVFGMFAAMSITASAESVNWTQPPHGQTVTEGQTVTFVVRGVCDWLPVMQSPDHPDVDSNLNLTAFRWGLKKPGGSWNYLYSSDIDGIIDPWSEKLTFTATRDMDGYQFCGYVLSLDFNSIASTYATLTVNPAPPVITQQPQSKSFVPGQTVQFTVEATGTDTLYYAWYVNGSILSTEREKTLTITNPTSAMSGNTYYCRVSNGGGSWGHKYTGIDSATATLSLLSPPPAAPTNLTATAGSGGITLNWESYEGTTAVGYRIERKEGSGGTWETIRDVNASTPTWVDATAEAGKAYYYRVRAYTLYAAEWSAYSNEATATMPAAAASPAAPTNLTATAGAGGITLNWQDNSDNEEMFSIYRKEGSGSFTLIRSVSANTTAYTDATAEAGKTYTYYVVAVKVGVPGFIKSNEATATMPAAAATSYTVTFNSNGGSAMASQTIPSGGIALYTLPNPTKDGYAFGGWYADAAFTTLYDFNTPVTANITLYAKWNEAAATSALPAITGPATMTLTEGYAATTTDAYTITGTPAPTVTKTGNAAIMWNDSSKKLEIGAGIAKGTYAVVLKAENSAGAAEFTFTLTVGEAAATPPATPPDSGTGAMSNFRKIRTYTPGMFSDVVESMWYGYEKDKSVANSYEYGLMSGYPDNTFKPAGNMTLAEAITIAARVHNIYNGGSGEFTQGSVWYQVYVDYAISNDIIGATDFNNYTGAATRAQMAYIFSRSVPAMELASRNTVNTLPDVNSGTPYYDAIQMMYKAGVVGGDEGTGAFRPGSNVSRAEAAAIITRVILPSSRLSGRTYG